MPDIFRTAQVHFNLYGRALPLRCEHPPRLMHWTYPLPLYLKGSVNIVTIHDLIPLRHPELTGIDARRMRRLLREVVPRADAIVTVSETVRAEIITELGVAPKRVFNLYQAVDVAGGEAGEAICPKGSFLVIGAVEKRKNIARLVAAHAASGVVNRLVVIGPERPGDFIPVPRRGIWPADGRGVRAGRAGDDLARRGDGGGGRRCRAAGGPAGCGGDGGGHRSAGLG
jgi:glycosyltransferase involved in cell wall biosynthesis